MRIKSISLFASGGLFIWCILFGPFLAYSKAILYSNPAQLILVLGGDVKREHVGMKLARKYKLPLVISGGSNPEHAYWLIEKSNIPLEKVTLDYRARDTLTNFTTLVDELSAMGIKHILIVTSKDHLRRAMFIGYIIAGSRGIRLSSMSVPCAPSCINEGLNKQIPDLIRAISWVAIGMDPKLFAQNKWQEEINQNLRFFFIPNSKSPRQVVN